MSILQCYNDDKSGVDYSLRRDKLNTLYINLSAHGIQFNTQGMPLFTINYLASSNTSPIRVSTTTAKKFNYETYLPSSSECASIQTQFGAESILSYDRVEFKDFQEMEIDKVVIDFILLRMDTNAIDTIEDNHVNRVLLTMKGTIYFSQDIDEDNIVNVTSIAMLSGNVNIVSPVSSSSPTRRYQFLVSKQIYIYSLLLILFMMILYSYWHQYISFYICVLLLIVLLCAHISGTFRTFLQWRDRGSRDYGKVFFVNGWQAWSFCGVVKQGDTVPPYALPHRFVRGFHAGSNALDINLTSASPLNMAPLFSTIKEYIASDMFTIIANTLSSKGICVGFLSQNEQFGYISSNADYNSLHATCGCDGVQVRANSKISTDWLAIHLQPILAQDTFSIYFNLAGQFNRASRMLSSAKIPVGWCSWYHFFERVSEKDLYKNIDDLVSIQKEYHLPAKLLFQIDDGYQDSWGDWLTLSLPKFPSQSMPALVAAIKEAKMVPGVWAAPFACDKHSQLAKDHPDWILRQHRSITPANSAHCGKWFYGIDVTNPDTQNFIRNTLEVAVKEWGFQYLKLDFLYAAALEHSQKSYHNPYLTRAQALQVGLDVIQSAEGVEDVFILGCGAPLGSVIGRVHANRISADAGLSWNPEFPLPSWDKWNLPCARNMVRNSLCRLSMHNRWWINDPDCILLRNSTKFTDDEIIGIASVKALSGGSIIISDDLKMLHRSRLRIAQSILPPIGLAAIPLDLLQREMPEILQLRLSAGNKQAPWTVLGLCNWGEGSKTHKVSVDWVLRSDHREPLSSHSDSAGGVSAGGVNSSAAVIGQESVLIIGFDFWKRRCMVFSEDNIHFGQLDIPFEVASHSAAIVAFRSVQDPTQPLYIGSDLHYSCGYELEGFYYSMYGNIAELNVTFQNAFLKNGDWAGNIWVYLPTPLQTGRVLETVRIRGKEQLLEEHFTVVEQVATCGSIVKIHVGDARNVLACSMDCTSTGMEDVHEGKSHLVLTWTVFSSSNPKK